jgi:hypothetical protein
MKTLFDLRDHSSENLDRLSMAIESGIVAFTEHKVYDAAETLIAYRNIIISARTAAIERESNEFVDQSVKEILG